MKLDKTIRTELVRTFLIEGLPEPLTPQSPHLQIFDNYIHETRLRLRSIRVPETKAWTHIMQQRFPETEVSRLEWKVAEIYLSELEYEHFKVFEGNEIRKNRYIHAFDGRDVIFDVYLGALWGLTRARVDFDDIDELRSFRLPSWAVVEVTGNEFFDDANLVKVGFADVQASVANSQLSNVQEI